MEKKMSVDSKGHVIPLNPFPLDNIFDPLHQFDPIETYEKVISNAPGKTVEQILPFFLTKSVPYFVNVNSLAWLYIV